MLTAMRIRNFKSFGPDGDWFPMGPLTLILGENSSGKSTILQALLLLSQSWQEPLQYLDLSGDGKHLKIGPMSNHRHRGRADAHEFGFRLGRAEVVLEYRVANDAGPAKLRMLKTKFDDTVAAEWEPTVDLANPAEVEWRMRNTRAWLATQDGQEARELEGAIAAADTAFDIDSQEKVQNDIEDLDYDMPSSHLEALQRLPELTEPQKIRFDLVVVQTPEDLRFGCRVSPASFLAPYGVAFDRERIPYATVRVEEFDMESGIPEVTELASLLEQHWSVVRQLRDLLAGTAYIGPMRSPGKRVYVDASNPSRIPYVGSDGRFLVHALSESGTELQAKVNRSLRRQEIPYELSVKTLGPSTGALIAKLQRQAGSNDGDSGECVDLCDVGFGVSQSLPVTAQWEILRHHPAVAGEGTRALVVEQPELHLHPRWQAELASALCDVWPIARADETDYEDTANGLTARTQAIVETHSELMVLRIARLVRTGELRPDENGQLPVVVLSAGRDGGCTEVRCVPIDDDGWFDRRQFFEGFFVDRVDEEMAT